MNQPTQLNQLPLVGPITIGPQPVPTNIHVAKVDAPNGQSLVVMQFATPQGVQMFFLDEACAKDVIRLLEGAVGAGIITARELVPAMPTLPPRPKS